MCVFFQRGGADSAYFCQLVNVREITVGLTICHNRFCFLKAHAFEGLSDEIGVGFIDVDFAAAGN